MTTTTTHSAELFDRAKRVLPGGVSRNTVLRQPHPAYAHHGEGCRLYDLDGREYVDYSNNMCSLIHGHADPDVTAAVTDQLARGSAFMMATEQEVEYAEHLCARSPNFQKMRFVNSGTEALMVCLKAARAHTGRHMIAKIEGAYHGGYDYAEVSQAPKPDMWGDIDRPNSVPLVHGTPQRALDDVVILPFNDIERSLKRLDEHKDELACVLLDLMPHRVGLNPVQAEFARAIADWTDRNRALLVLDEVITFRSEVGGLQTRYDVHADLTAMGKLIGGGFPVGAVAGSADVMDTMNPHGDNFVFPHSGTFSANPISTTAGLVAMKKFDDAAVARLNALAQRGIDGINAAIERTGATACVTGTGSMFRVHMKPEAPHNYREAHTTPEENARLNVMLDHLFHQGCVMINTCTAALSTPMGEAEIDHLVRAMEGGLAKIADMP